MTDAPHWYPKFQTRRRELLAQLEACRTQQSAAVSELPSRSNSTDCKTRSFASGLPEYKSETNDGEDGRCELGADQVQQALKDLYTDCLGRTCNQESSYEDQIRTLLAVFQDDIPSRIVADVVGCSRGHARRFEWDCNREEVREKAWSRKQRTHQATPSMVRQVRIRDTNECVRCGSDDELNIHHIEPVSQHGPADMWNLATLCHQCHKAAHGGSISSGEAIHNSTKEFWRWASENE